MGLMPRPGRPPGGGNGSPLPGSCREDPMDRGAWRAGPQGHKESDTTEVSEHARVQCALKAAPTLVCRFLKHVA